MRFTSGFTTSIGLSLALLLVTVHQHIDEKRVYACSEDYYKADTPDSVRNKCRMHLNYKDYRRK